MSCHSFSPSIAIHRVPLGLVVFVVISYYSFIVLIIIPKAGNLIIIVIAADCWE